MSLLLARQLALAGFRSLLAKGVSGAGTAAAAYSLTADQGSYGLTGQTIGLLAARTAAAEQGSYSLTGQDVGLRATLLLTAGQGSYALSGQDVTLTYTSVAVGFRSLFARGMGGGGVGDNVIGFRSLFAKNLSGAGRGANAYSLTADYGSYSILGSDALADYVVSMGQGSYALTGQDVGLRATFVLTAGHGAYALSGVSATLVYSGGGAAVGFTSLLAKGVSGAGRPLGAYSLTADYGSYSLLGSDALADFQITLEPGSYLLSGQDVTLTSTGTVVIPPSTGGAIGGGGGGGRRHRGWDEAESRRKRKLDEDLEASIRRIYRELTEEPATAELAGEIVQSIATVDVAVPPVRDVEFERATVEIELALRMLRAELDALRAEEAEIAEILEILDMID